MPIPFSAATRAVAAAATAALAAAACRHAAPASDAPPSPDVAGAIGASPVFGARILGVDLARGRVRYSLAAPAHVLLLSVSPSSGIVPLAIARREGAGRHVALAGTGTTANGRASTGASPEARAEYERCASRAQDAAPRPRPPQRRVVRDTSGREVAVPQPSLDQEIAAERRAVQAALAACQRQASARPAAPGRRPALPGHVLLIASDTPIGTVDLVERLGALSVTGDDVASVMAGIAEGLFADRRAVWSGYYRQW